MRSGSICRRYFHSHLIRGFCPLSNSLLDRYSSLELREYRRVFRSTDEAGQLDNVPRRYAWFRRVLAEHDAEREGAFLPEGWGAGLHLVARFAEATTFVFPPLRL